LIKVVGPGSPPPRLPEAERELKKRFRDPARLAASEVADALTFLDEIAPQPTNQGLAPIWLRVGSNFQIKDPATGRAFPGQDQERYRGVEYASSAPLGTSGLLLSLHNYASLAVNLCIPDPDQDTLGRVVPWLQEQLPFRLSPTQWRIWSPTKTGSFRARRMLVPRSWPAPPRVTFPHAVGSRRPDSRPTPGRRLLRVEIVLIALAVFAIVAAVVFLIRQGPPKKNEALPGNRDRTDGMGGP
jgi:hypothetical protein